LDTAAKTRPIDQHEPRLLTEERRRLILDLLEENGRVTVDELVARFHVSAVTVRGDLDALSAHGALKRSHGGAVRIGPIHDYPLRIKESLHHDEKVRIAQAAVELIRPNQTIILDSGSTTAEVARQLRRFKNGPVTVITNSLSVADELANAPFVNLIMVGGILRHISRSFVGPQAEQMMRDLHANHLFLGVDGIDPEAGPSTPDILEAQLNGMMMRAAEEVTIVADSSKFGRRSLSVIGPIDRVARIITDTGIDPAVSEVLHRRGIKMIVV
jgi:DeoR family transcriptional regulator, aga operon transcriptional repressor